MKLHVIAKLTLIAVIAITSLVTGESVARADATCTPLVSPLLDWGRQRHRRLFATSTGIQKDGQWAAYSTGFLRYDAATDRLVGEVATTFSDRIKTVDAVGCSGPDCGVLQPFWRNAADRATIEIARDGTVTLHSITWGGTVTLPVSCRDGYLLYFDGWSLTMLELTQVEFPR